MNDLVRFSMVRACDIFGGSDRIFNNASFATAFAKISGVKNKLDGRYVMAILSGRKDVEILHGGSHFKIILLENKRKFVENDGANFEFIQKNLARDEKIFVNSRVKK